MEEQKQSETGEAEVKLPPEAVKDLSPDEDEAEKVKGGAIDAFSKTNLADSSSANI